MIQILSLKKIKNGLDNGFRMVYNIHFQQRDLNMIQNIVDLFMTNKDKLEFQFNQNCPKSYKELVSSVINIVQTDDYHSPGNTIHEINDGDYQGALLYLIPMNYYQPSDYYLIKIQYGSCSACDTLQAIQDEYWHNSKEQAVKDLMTLALHIIQSIKII